jgi:hypothetical protein
MPLTDEISALRQQILDLLNQEMAAWIHLLACRTRS